MKYPLLKQTEHAFDLNALDQACAVLEDEQLYDLHYLLCCDFDHDMKSLDGITWTVTPANTEREEYKITATVSDLVKMLMQSYCFLSCVGWNTLDIRVGCSEIYLYGYFAQVGFFLD